MPKAQIDDIQVYYEEAGSGEAVVFITGLAGIYRDWRLQAPYFSRHYRTIVLDNRGVGRTDKPKDGYSIRRFADDTVGLMDHLKVERAHVVGLSMGGMIAQEMALSYPSRVDRLALCVTNCGQSHAVLPEQEVLDVITNPTGKTYEDIVRQSLPILFTERYLQEMKDEVETYVQDKLDSPRQTFHSYNGQLQAAMEFDSYDLLPRIAHHTMVLTASGDVLVPPANSKVLADRIPNSRLYIFEEGGHMFNIERSEEFNQVVLEFLSQ